MNKFIYPLAAAAALCTGNLFAQEAALITPNADSAFDCVQENTRQNRTLVFEGSVVTQEFTACTSGTLSAVEVAVKGMTEDVWYLAEIVNNHGEVLDDTRFTHRNIVNEIVQLNLMADVEEGKNYALQLTTPEEGDMSLRYQLTNMGTLWNDGEPVRGTLTAKFGFNTDNTQYVQSEYATRNGETPETRAMENECKTSTGMSDGKVKLTAPGHVITQSYTACANGTMTSLALNIAHHTAEFEGRIRVENEEGDVLMNNKLDRTNIVKDAITLPVNAEVTAGETLTFYVKLGSDTQFAIKRNTQANVGECKLNGVSMDFNLDFTSYIKESHVGENADLDAAAITTFPNPFNDRINVRMENAPKGPATVQLLDFSGNIIRTETVIVKDAAGNISFDTRDIDGAGYYALRIIQGDQIKNVTVLKR
jgi:hypothetical protein|tara:strand:+ start:691 stop:1956 length:1266 start_codon:yes stop_codon:yes gene_type:complete